MQRATLLTLVAITLGGIAYYTSQPATVNVGSTRIKIKESKVFVFIRNTVGDLKGYSHCYITGLNFDWAPATGLKYNPSRGVIYSDYAVDFLLQMKDQQEAYRIAQEAFDRLQKEAWGNDNDNKLLYPLQTLTIN